MKNHLHAQGIRMLFAGALAIAATAAEAQEAPGYNVDISVDNAKTELHAVIQETATHPQGCDLVLSRLEYLADLQILSVELSPDFCPIDRIGHRKGQVTWNLPRPLRSAGEISLRVNGKVIGKVEMQAAGARWLPLPLK